MYDNQEFEPSCKRQHGRLMEARDFFLQFWEGAIRPFKLGKLARQAPRLENCYSAQLCHFDQ